MKGEGINSNKSRLVELYKGYLHLPPSLRTDSSCADADKHINTSAVRWQNSGKRIVKSFNLLPVAVSTTVELLPLLGRPTDVAAAVQTGKPDDTNAKAQPTTISMDDSCLQCELPPYSFLVVSIKP